MSRKIRVGVVFGGRSGGHEVSLRSAESIIRAMDKSKYEVVPIGITKEGKWLKSEDAKALLPRDVIDSKVKEHVAIIGDPTKTGLVSLKNKSDKLKSEKLDVIFPVLHGTYGEDETIQGIFDIAYTYRTCCTIFTCAGMNFTSCLS